MLKSKLRKKVLKIRKIAYLSKAKIDSKKIFKLIRQSGYKIKSVGGYFPVNSEIDDLEILKKLSKKNYKICLPVIRKNFHMDFYQWSFDEPLSINKYGIPEPKLKTLVNPDLILVPIVAFDKNLNRLGYGGGFYDRTIDSLRSKKDISVLGLAFECQRTTSMIPVEPTDQKMDWVLTERGLYSFNSTET